jgi:hypothetical protein
MIGAKEEEKRCVICDERGHSAFIPTQEYFVRCKTLGEACPYCLLTTSDCRCPLDYVGMYIPNGPWPPVVRKQDWKEEDTHFGAI